MTSNDEKRLALLVRAATAAPQDTDARERAVAALVAAGKKARARKLAGTPKLKQPAAARLAAVANGKAAAPEALRSEAAAFFRKGEPRQLAELLRAYPGDPGLHVMASAHHFLRFDFQAAADHARTAVSLDPENVEASANLGLALLRLGRISEAIAVMEPVANGAGDNAALKTNLASAYLRADRPERALSLVRPIFTEDRQDPDIAGVLASALLAVGEVDEAYAIARPMAELADLAAEAVDQSAGRQAALSFVTELRDISRETRLRLAERLGSWGETGMAASLLEPLLADRTNPEAARLYGLFTTWSDDNDARSAMEAGIANERLPAARRRSFGAALAKARRDTGDLDGAMRALATGNAILAAEVPARPEAFDRLLHSIRAWTADVIRDLSRYGDPSVAPVFIIGLPRTGSTLLETMLSRHQKIHALGESPRLYAAAAGVRDYVSATAVAKVAEEAEWLRPPDPATRVTDKLLANAEHAGLLAAAFPRAAFIEVRRDWRAAALSMWEADLSPTAHPYTLDQQALVRRIAQHVRLTAHWQSVLGPRLQTVSYEALVTEPEAELRALLDGLGLPFDPSCLSDARPSRRITTLSVGQANRPVHRGSLARWKAVAHHFAPLLDGLAKEGLIDDGEG